MRISNIPRKWLILGSVAVGMAIAVTVASPVAQSWRFETTMSVLRASCSRDLVVLTESEVPDLSRYRFNSVIVVADTREASWWSGPRIVGASFHKCDLSMLKDTTPFTDMHRLQLYQSPPGALRVHKMQELQEAVVSRSGITDAELQGLAGWKMLRVLSLQDEPEVTTSGICEILRACPLRSIMLLKTPNVDDGIASCLAKSDQLLTLSLSGMQFGDGSARGLGSAKELRHVQLIGTSLTDEGLSSLGQSRSIESLQIVGAPAVSVNGIRRLDEVDSLRELVISGTAVIEADRDDIELVLENCEVHIGR